MKKRLRFVVAILGVTVLLTGCAASLFAPPGPEQVDPAMTAERLARLAWIAQPGVYRLRQTVLFEFNGSRVPIVGVMKLDYHERRARLVAMNDLGMKLFDLIVDENGEDLNSLLPDLAKIPRFGEAVAASVRRIFLAPLPDPKDTLLFGKDRYLLKRHWRDGEIRFTFGGGDTRLLETTVAVEGSDWKAEYFEYGITGDVVYPRGIILHDRLAGYRLILWIEEMEPTDE
ncbi:MAG: DUF3261 domain-containing protein [Nitrospirota bacterium]|nr:DUF3261 domain-containing protein [Nitrospirota bacterium]